jgi:hypothetical protein
MLRLSRFHTQPQLEVIERLDRPYLELILSPKIFETKG